MSEEQKRHGKGVEPHSDRQSEAGRSACCPGKAVGTCPSCGPGAAGAPLGHGQSPPEPLDPMEAYLADLPEWARGPIMEYGKQAAAAILLLLVAVAIWSGYGHYTANRNAEAAHALGQVFALTDTAEKATRLKKIITQYKGTAAADQAELLLAGQLLEEGKWSEAAAQFSKAEGLLSGVLRDAAIMGQGYCLEEQGDMKGAAKAYERAVDTANGFETVAILDKARVLEIAGDIEGAMAAYDAYLDMKPQSPDLAFIRFQVMELSAKEAKASQPQS